MNRLFVLLYEFIWDLHPFVLSNWQQQQQHSLGDELKREYVFNVFICRIARKLPLVCVYIATFIVVFVAVSCWGYCCCCYCCLWCCELDKFSSQLTNLPRLTRCLYYITQFTLRYICTKAIKHTLLMLIQYTWYTYITYTCCYIHYT